MPFELKPIACPLCARPDPEPLVPSRKLDGRSGKWQVTRDIWVSLCTNCGTIFEDPQVDVLKSREYNESHYYNDSSNRPEEHDKLQNMYAPFRWEVLSSRIDWSNVKRAMDVGATGAWSATLKTHQPHVESVLLEPSRAAIEFCKSHYPRVVPMHGMLEEISGGVQPFDVITMFYSLYHICDPVAALKKCRSLLSPDGRLIVCISQAHMELEMWSGNRTVPWVDMELFVRGVMLTYFSRRTLEAALRLAGFRIDSVFAAKHGREGAWKGREDWFVIAERSTGNEVPVLSNPEEVRWARQFVKNLCVNASRASLRKFLSNRSVKRVALVCKDDVYRDWARKLLEEHGLEVQIADPGTSPAELESSLRKPGTCVFNATWTPLAGLPGNPDNVVDCIQGNRVDGDFDLWCEGKNGEVIITKALLPSRDVTLADYYFPGPGRARSAA